MKVSYDTGKAPRYLRKLLRDFPEWHLGRSRGGHLRLEHPTLGCIFAPQSPSDWRGVRNLAAQLRRAERGVN